MYWINHFLTVTSHSTIEFNKPNLNFYFTRSRFGNASPVGDEYDDEYNYEEMYDYDDNSQNAGGDDYEVTSETSETESTKPPSTVRNETAVESSPKIVGIDEEPRTEPIRNVLIAETG